MEELKLTKYGEVLIIFETPLSEETDWIVESFASRAVLTTHMIGLKGEDLGNIGDASIIGKHKICNGFVDIFPVSEEWNTIVCRRCDLRLYIPKSVKNYRDLRKYLGETDELKELVE